jgi:hypothetical protein
VNYTKEELLGLSEKLDEVLDGHTINLCISALMTSFVSLVTSTAPSATDAREITEHVHEQISPEAVQALWTGLNQATRH